MDRTSFALMVEIKEEWKIRKQRGSQTNSMLKWLNRYVIVSKTCRIWPTAWEYRRKVFPCTPSQRAARHLQRSSIHTYIGWLYLIVDLGPDFLRDCGRSGSWSAFASFIHTQRPTLCTNILWRIFPKEEIVSMAFSEQSLPYKRFWGSCLIHISVALSLIFCMQEIVGVSLHGKHPLEFHHL